VIGELVEETPEAVTLRWQHGEVAFKRSEIVQIQRPQAPSALLDATPAPAPSTVTLHLKNGERVTGELLHELPNELILKFEYGEVSFFRSEILRVERAAAPAAPAADTVLP
jgi:hypothetical protein